MRWPGTGWLPATRAPSWPVPRAPAGNWRRAHEGVFPIVKQHRLPRCSAPAMLQHSHAVQRAIAKSVCMQKLRHGSLTALFSSFLSQAFLPAFVCKGSGARPACARAHASCHFSHLSCLLHVSACLHTLLLLCPVDACPVSGCSKAHCLACAACRPFFAAFAIRLHANACVPSFQAARRRLPCARLVSLPPFSWPFSVGPFRALLPAPQL